MKNYYDLLEVNPKASNEIIEKAYKVLIKKYHPDLYQGEERMYAESKTRELNEAYRVLSNDFLREQYDLELEKEKQFNSLNNQEDLKVNNNSYNDGNRGKRIKNKKENYEEKEHKVGTAMSIVDLLKAIFKKRNFSDKPKEIKKEDKLAAIITLVIVLIIGVALWFIPATNGFIRSMIPF